MVIELNACRRVIACKGRRVDGVDFPKNWEILRNIGEPKFGRCKISRHFKTLADAVHAHMPPEISLNMLFKFKKCFQNQLLTVAIHHAGLCGSLQMQQETDTGIPESVELQQRHFPNPRHEQHSEHGSHQAQLLWKPSFHRSTWHHPHRLSSRLLLSP